MFRVEGGTVAFCAQAALDEKVRVEYLTHWMGR